MNKEDIIEKIKEYYKIYGKVPTVRDNIISRSLVTKIFGSWNNLLTISGHYKAKSFITECSNCYKKIKKILSQKNINNHYFCNHSCSAIFTNKNRSLPTNEQKIKTSKSLNEYLYKYTKLIFIDNVNCLECGINFEFKCSSKNPPKYCSYRCVGVHSNKIRSNVSYRRSKNEIYFSELCMEWYSNVVTNKKMFDGWDCDIILLDHKIAIAWNGFYHYHQIWSHQPLYKVEIRDREKEKIFTKNGYIYYVIKDLGKHNKKFVKEQFEIFQMMQIDY